MPVITATTMQGTGARAVTETTLNGTDSFTYNASARPVLELHNPTGAPISPVIDGAGGTNVSVPGLGQVSVADGYTVGAIAAGATVAIPLATISAYLQGAIAITSGSGLVARLFEF